MFGFLAQIAINIYVLRGSLAKDHPRAPQSDTRVAIAGSLLPFIGLLGVIPAAIAIYALDATTTSYVVGVAAAIVMSLVSQGFFVSKMHRLRFGAGLYLATKLWLIGAGIGVLAVIHPLVPLVVVGGFLASKVAQKHSADQLSRIADTL